MRTFLVLLFFFNSFSFAREKNLGAHEHGALKIDMAIEKNQIEISFDGPAENFLGFEYLPKTTKEKKLYTKTENLWKKDLFQLFNFDKKLNCKILDSSFKQVVEGSHSDIDANAKISCLSDVKSSSVLVTLKKHFTHIKKLKIEVISETPHSFEIIKPIEVITL